MQIHPHALPGFVSFADALEADATYTLSELAMRGAPAHVIAIFDGMDAVPAVNALTAAAVTLGVDELFRLAVDDATCGDESMFPVHRLRVAIRRRVNELLQQVAVA